MGELEPGRRVGKPGLQLIHDDRKLQSRVPSFLFGRYMQLQMSICLGMPASKEGHSFESQEQWTEPRGSFVGSLVSGPVPPYPKLIGQSIEISKL